MWQALGGPPQRQGDGVFVALVLVLVLENGCY